jgi:hypothetical protein
MRLRWGGALLQGLYLINSLSLLANYLFMSTILKKKSSKRDISKTFNKAINRKGVDTAKYCGVIKLSNDALAIQKELRNEWEECTS